MVFLIHNGMGSAIEASVVQKGVITQERSYITVNGYIGASAPFNVVGK
jgi:hypothetical protein